VLSAYVLRIRERRIFWNNHHHMLHVTSRNGKVLWANLALLFWLSLVPFVIRWIDEMGFTALPTAAYGVVLLCAAVSYQILQQQLIAYNGRDSRLAAAVGTGFQGQAVPESCISPPPSCWRSSTRGWPITLYVAGGAAMAVPDRRIESLVKR